MNKGIYLLSHMRTGSTWLMHLLTTFYGNTTGGAYLKYKTPHSSKIINYLNNGYIVKAHRWGQYSFKEFNYPVVSIVRNPLDRFTSVYFRLKRTRNTSYNKAKRICFFSEKGDTQLLRMEKGFSTRTRDLNSSDIPYIWTTYEWLLKNPKKELRAILNFLEISYTSKDLNRALERGNKNTKGTSNFRKGIIGDWKNFIPKKDVKILIPFYEKYMEILKYEENSRNNNNIR